MSFLPCFFSSLFNYPLISFVVNIFVLFHAIPDWLWLEGHLGTILSNILAQSSVSYSRSAQALSTLTQIF